MSKANKPSIPRSLFSSQRRTLKGSKLIAIFFLTMLFVSHAPEAQAQSTDIFAEPNRVPNPYCKVPTYVSARFNGPARAMIDGGERPLIVINTDVISKVGLVDFFMAHECCHHRLGHLKRERKPIPSLNGRALTTMNAKMEADADCCAAKLLTFKHNTRAIEKAKRFMGRFGRVPTGFGYPTGAARLGAINACHKRAQKEFANKFVNKSASEKQSNLTDEDW